MSTLHVGWKLGARTWWFRYFHLLRGRSDCLARMWVEYFLLFLRFHNLAWVITMMLIMTRLILLLHAHLLLDEAFDSDTTFSRLTGRMMIGMILRIYCRWIVSRIIPSLKHFASSTRRKTRGSLAESCARHDHMLDLSYWLMHYMTHWTHNS